MSIWTSILPQPKRLHLPELFICLLLQSKVHLFPHWLGGLDNRCQIVWGCNNPRSTYPTCTWAMEVFWQTSPCSFHIKMSDITLRNGVGLVYGNSFLHPTVHDTNIAKIDLQLNRNSSIFDIVTSMLHLMHIQVIWHISRPSKPSKPSDPASCIRFHFLPLGSLFYFRFPYTLILLLLSSAQIITRLTIPLHLSFPLLPFVLDTSDPLMEQGISSSI